MRASAKFLTGLFVSGFAFATLAAIPSASAQTLKTVKDRGILHCGVSQGIEGFSAQNASGTWAGLDVDFCRALAAAIFNDATKVRFTPLSAQDRFDALKSGSIDVLARNSTWTLSREAQLGLMFGAITYFDGQSFLVKRALNTDTALELGGKSICVQTGTTTEPNLADFFKANKMDYKAVTFGAPAESLAAYQAGRCEALTSDASQLYAERAKLPTPADHVILPDIISKEPLAPAVRAGDDQWLNIVKWTHYAMVTAEELGITAATVEAALKSDKPDVRRFVGTEGNLGEQLGLTKDWAVRIVGKVGNYAEAFERNVGSPSRLGIPRGINALWTQGGLQYAPPVR
jgi:general L-amino acid transport system substrate-binding protein